MGELRFDIDVEAIIKDLGGLRQDIEKDLVKSVENLATMTHAKTRELARDKLSSLSEMYQNNLEFTSPSEGLWVVTLKEPAMWIEEGRKAGFMEELLNTVQPGKSPVKQGKNGKYRVIPFVHSKKPTEQSATAKELSNQIKESLSQTPTKTFVKRKGEITPLGHIPWKEIEYDRQGSPRTGRLHTLNVESARLKSHHKTSPITGVAIYQRQGEGGSVRRDVLTFRVISEKHRNEGLWNHPGRAGDQLMDEALKWAMETWEREILPAVLKRYDRD